MWNMNIEKIQNGFIIISTDDDQSIKTVFQFDEDKGREDLKNREIIQRLLYFILEYFDELGTRYDKKRIKIILKKGDKHEN